MAGTSIWSLFCLLTIAAGAPPASGGEDSSAGVEVRPAEVAMNMFFTGATIYVEGPLPDGVHDVAVVLAGPDEDLELKKKGRVGGVLWMNVGEVVFHHVPTVYVVAATGPLDSLAPPAVLEKLELGYAAIKSRSASGPGNEEQRRLFDELLALKEEGGFYAVREDGARREPETADGPARFAADCRLPSQTSIGEYSVQVFGFPSAEGKDAGELLATTTVTVRQVGASAMIRSLAQDSGLLYGVLSVVIAIVVGLLTGFLFGGRSKGGH
jgi:uncharacterized protein (TIGR02186 family)